MSWEAEVWARQQRTGSPALKSVLLSIANWINARNDWAEVSLKRIAKETEISLRSVQRHVVTLAQAGFLETEARYDTAHSGRQGWNAYRFRGYSAIKVSCDGPEPAPTGGGTPTTNCHGEGDRLSPDPTTPVACPIPKQDTLPPLPSGDAPKGATPPAARRAAKGSPLPIGWQPPAIEALGPSARALASAWPEGAYAAEAEKFVAHWRACGGAKADWPAAWGKWVITAAPEVARAVKAGVVFAAPSAAVPEVPAGRDSCAVALGIRELVRAGMAPETFRAWIAPLDLAVRDGQLIVSSTSQYRIDRVKQDFRDRFRRAAGALEVVFQVRGSA